jgi:hypothetical protein
MADSQDLEVLIRYLWVEDKHSFRNQLDLVKLHFFLLCLAYTVARAGAVVVSDSYRNSNEAMTYRVSISRFYFIRLLTRLRI